VTLGNVEQEEGGLSKEDEVRIREEKARLRGLESKKVYLRAIGYDVLPTREITVRANRSQPAVTVAVRWLFNHGYVRYAHMWPKHHYELTSKGLDLIGLPHKSWTIVSESIDCRHRVWKGEVWLCQMLIDKEDCDTKCCEDNCPISVEVEE